MENKCVWHITVTGLNINTSKKIFKTSNRKEMCSPYIKMKKD
jgi:hypothetical protein